MSENYERLSPGEKETRSTEAIRHLSMEIHELVDLRSRQTLARSILGHSDNPVCQQALAALDGKPLSAIAEESADG